MKFFMTAIIIAVVVAVSLILGDALFLLYGISCLLVGVCLSIVWNLEKV